MDVLTVNGLTRTFGPVTANDNIDLQVAAGEIVGLLGHNGAGKTTLISQLVGLLKPDAGSIRLAGIDAVADPATARANVALQPQGQVPIEGLTPRLAIQLAGRIRGMSRAAANRRAVELAEALDITQWLDQRALPEGRGLSGGVRRLVGFAMAVVAPAPLIVLDEPTNDVDAGRRPRLWRQARRSADEGAAVLLVTHNVNEAERIVDRLAILNHGRLVAAGTPAQLRGTDARDLSLELQLPAIHRIDAAQVVASLPTPARRVIVDGRRLRLTIDAADAARTIDWATEQRLGGQLDAYTLAPASLEDTYLQLTAGQPSTPTDSAASNQHTQGAAR